MPVTSSSTSGGNGEASAFLSIRPLFLAGIGPPLLSVTPTEQYRIFQRNGSRGVLFRSACEVLRLSHQFCADLLCIRDALLLYRIQLVLDCNEPLPQEVVGAYRDENDDAHQKPNEASVLGEHLQRLLSGHHYLLLLEGSAQRIPSGVVVNRR